MARQKQPYSDEEMQSIMEKEYFLERNGGVLFSSIAPYSKKNLSSDKHSFCTGARDRGKV